MSDDTLAQRTATAMFERDLASAEARHRDRGGEARLRAAADAGAPRHGQRPRHLPRRLHFRARRIAAFAFACNSHNRATVAAGAAIEFLAPVRAGDVLIAEAQEQSLGGRLGVYDVVVSREAGERVALFRGRSYALRTPVIADEGLL